MSIKLMWLVLPFLIYCTPNVCLKADGAANGNFNIKSLDDYCPKKIPTEIQFLLNQKFPSFRLPQKTDNLREDIEQDIKDGGDGCLGLSIGKFFNSESNDYAIILTEINGDGGILVAVSHLKTRWKVEVIEKVPEGRKRLFVRRLKAGKYTNIHSRKDVAYDRNEIGQINTKLDGIGFGRTESSAVGFFRTKGKWVHLQLDD